jgi:hypothetical protein
MSNRQRTTRPNMKGSSEEAGICDERFPVWGCITASTDGLAELVERGHQNSVQFGTVQEHSALRSSLVGLASAPSLAPGMGRRRTNSRIITSRRDSLGRADVDLVNNASSPWIQPVPPYVKVVGMMSLGDIPSLSWSS